MLATGIAKGFFNGLHRLIIVIAIVIGLFGFAVSYSDYSQFRSRLDSFRVWQDSNAHLKTDPLHAQVDGDIFTAPIDTDDLRLFVRSMETDADKAAILLQLRLDRYHRQEILDNEPARPEFDGWILVWPVAMGLGVYCFGLLILLVGRWIIRGFLSPPSDAGVYPVPGSEAVAPPIQEVKVPNYKPDFTSAQADYQKRLAEIDERYRSGNLDIPSLQAEVSAALDDVVHELCAEDRAARDRAGIE